MNPSKEYSFVYSTPMIIPLTSNSCVLHRSHGYALKLEKKIKTHAVSLFLSLQTKQDTSVRNHIARRRSMWLWLWRTQFGHKIPRGYIYTIPVRTLGPVYSTQHICSSSLKRKKRKFYMCVLYEIWWLQSWEPKHACIYHLLCNCTLPGPYMQASVLSRQIIVLINVAVYLWRWLLYLF